MIEKRVYSKEEIESILGTNTREKTKKKLDRYDVEYEITGRGDYFIEIREIKNPFKLYCILEIGFPAQTDFNRLKDFMYWYLNDEEFRNRSDEQKERAFDNMGEHVSRQTFAKWENRLIARGFVSESLGEYYYYFISKDQIVQTDEKTYKKAWSGYWRMTGEGFSTRDAISDMRVNYGGIAKKRRVPLFNVFCASELDILTNMVNDTIDFEPDN